MAPFLTEAVSAQLQQKESFESLRWEDLPQAERFRLAFVLRDLSRAERTEKERRRVGAGAGAGGKGGRGRDPLDRWLDEEVL